MYHFGATAAAAGEEFLGNQVFPVLVIVSALRSKVQSLSRNIDGI
jgi:hypothetical protein